MEEQYELKDIADNLIIINKATIERLFQEDNTDVVVLYMFYYKTAKWQNHNPIKANDEYTRRCLHWGLDRVKNIKKRLKEMELIEVEKRVNEKQQIIGWYIRINYLEASGVNSTSRFEPLVAKQHHKILLDNNINTNNNINKENIKEREIVDNVIQYLNERLGTQYRTSTPSTRKHILARIHEGYNIFDFAEVIESKYDEWHGTDMEKYLRPDTLFGTKFEIYLNNSKWKKDN